jgi:hypothetical protein
MAQENQFSDFQSSQQLIRFGLMLYGHVVSIRIYENICPASWGLAGDYRVNVNNTLYQRFPNFLGDETLFIQ